MAKNHLRGMILEVGCNAGHLYSFLERHVENNFTYIGIDLSRGLILRGRETYLGFDAIVADAMHLPFRVKLFDVVFCLETFEHLTDPKTALEEFRSHMKCTGRLVIGIPNYRNPLLALWGILGLGASMCEQEHRFTPKIVKRILSKLFTIDEMRGAGYPYYIPSINTLCMYVKVLQKIFKPTKIYKVSKASKLGKMPVFKLIEYIQMFLCSPRS